jgi:hypothetical protein
MFYPNAFGNLNTFRVVLGAFAASATADHQQRISAFIAFSKSFGFTVMTS